MPANRRPRLRWSLLLIIGFALLLGVTAYSLGAPAETSPSSSATEQQVRQAFVDLGVLEEGDVDCLLDGIRDAGFAAEEILTLAEGGVPEGVGPAAYTEASEALLACLDDETLREFTAKSLETSPPETVRNSFVTTIMTVSPVAMTRAQGGCVYDSLVASGIDFSDLITETGGPEVDSALSDAWVMCGLL